MDIRETISKVPAWGWVAGGGLILGLFFLMNRGSGASTTTSSGGLAPDANSILQQLQNAAGGGGGGGGSSNTGNTPTSGTTQVLSGYTAKISNKSGIPYFASTGGKMIDKLYNATVRTSLPKKVNGVWWYQITSSSNKALIGKWFKATSSGVTWTKNYTQGPTTTATTSSVQTSNNAVA